MNKLMTGIELKEASMAFELKSGETILISKEDIERIAEKMIIEMVINKQNFVFMYRSTAIEKATLLYKVVLEQQKVMTDEVKNNYFTSILTIINNDEKEFITLEEDIKDWKNKGHE